jgi:hypothetical protein
MRNSGMSYVIKAEIRDVHARTWSFAEARTMYGGKRIAAGDTIFVFASENEGGQGLIARGVVLSAEAIPKRPGVERQTPCVRLFIEKESTARRRLGRAELKPFNAWNDGQPRTELNFKLYRQATNKVVGISDSVAAFLNRFFNGAPRARRQTHRPSTGAFHASATRSSAVGKRKKGAV